MFDFIFELIWGSELAKMVPFLILSYWFYLIMHIGLSRTVKIFKKIELGVSMARLTSNLVNASQIKWNMTENFSLKALVGLSDVFSYNWANIIK